MAIVFKTLGKVRAILEIFNVCVVPATYICKVRKSIFAVFSVLSGVGFEPRRIRVV